MTIAQITDTHIDDNTILDRGGNPRTNLDAVLADIATRNVNLIVFTGDISHEEQGFESTYGDLFGRLNATGLPYRAILGNHDHVAVAMKYYKGASEAENELYYSSEDNTHRYIFLDSSSERVSDAQLDWLRQQVHTDKKLVVFIHHPIVSITTGMDRIYPLKNRDVVNEILQPAMHPVTVFCGHYHMPDMRVDGNITQYTTPAVSFQVNKQSAVLEINVNSFGYRLIDITGEGIGTHLVISRNNNFAEEKDIVG